MPLISIIVPVYNVEKYLEKCILSIIHQTYTDLEIILIDDGSPDRSGSMCDVFARKDPRIKVIHKTNGGVNSARNAGLALATGDYIGLVDSDDHLEPDMYELLITTMVDNNADISMCGHYIEKNGMITACVRNDGSTQIMTKEEAVRAVLIDKEIRSYVWDKLYKRKLFENFQYPNIAYLDDLAATFLLMEKAQTVAISNRSKYFYMQNPLGMTSNLTNLKLYHAFLAYARRQPLIEEKYRDLIDMNIAILCTIGINVLNRIIRAGEHNTTLKDGYNEITRFCKNNIKKILFNHQIPIKFKIYSSLAAWYSPLYVFICTMNILNRLHGLKKLRTDNV